MMIQYNTLIKTDETTIIFYKKNSTLFKLKLNYLILTFFKDAVTTTPLSDTVHGIPL